MYAQLTISGFNGAPGELEPATTEVAPATEEMYHGTPLPAVVDAFLHDFEGNDDDGEGDEDDFEGNEEDTMHTAKKNREEAADSGTFNLVTESEDTEDVVDPNEDKRVGSSWLNHLLDSAMGSERAEDDNSLFKSSTSKFFKQPASATSTNAPKSRPTVVAKHDNIFDD